MPSVSLKTKLKNAFRIDRAARFVWRASPRYTLLSGAVVIVLGVLPLAALYLVKLIIDQVTGLVSAPPAGLLDPAFSQTALLIGAACCIGLLTALFNFAAGYLKKAQTLTVADHMYGILHEQSKRIDLSFYESPELKDTLFRAQQEAFYRPAGIVEGLLVAAQSGASFIAVVWLLFVFNPILPLVLMVTAVPGVLLRFRYSAKIYAWQEKRAKDERLANYFHFMLTGDDHAKEFRLFDLSGHFMVRFKTIRRILRSEKLGLEIRRAMSDFIAQASSILAVFGSFVYIALKTAVGEITIGDMVLYFQAFQRGLGFLKTLLETCAQMYDDNLFLSHFYAFLKMEPKVKPPLTPLSVPERFKTGIEVKNVEFSYQKSNKKVLKCVNFSINSGEVVALVGENGSGKSTIVKILTRLYDPDKGSVFLDGIDIKAFHPDSYRKKISVVFQDHMRYFLKAREAINLGNLEKECFQGIQAAAENSGIHRKINQMPNGYDTVLGRLFQSGEELSAGQWQMLAIARAFYRDAQLVIMDEPSSALDPENETRLFNTMRKLIRNRSALIISHRYSSVRMADRILVMDKGRIIEQGSHEELMRLDGKYTRLYNAQAKGYSILKEDVI